MNDENKFNFFSSDYDRICPPKNKRNDVRYQILIIKHGEGSECSGDAFPEMRQTSYFFLI